MVRNLKEDRYEVIYVLKFYFVILSSNKNRWVEHIELKITMVNPQTLFGDFYSSE